MRDAQNRRNSSPKDLGRSEPSEFHTERSGMLRLVRTTGIPHRAILGAQAIGIPHRAVQDAQNHRNSSPSNPGRSEPSEFHTERSTILKTAEIPHRASERSKIAQNHQNSVQDHQYLRNSTARGRSDCLRTFVIPHQAIQDAQNRRNSAPSGPAFLEPLSDSIPECNPGALKLTDRTIASPTCPFKANPGGIQGDFVRTDLG